MNFPRIAILSALCGVLAPFGGAAFAQSESPKPLPFVSPIFGDNMMLQRGKLNTIWGWSEPGDTVRVQVADQTASATAGPDRRWQVKIQPPPAGGPYTIKISGRQTVELQNVLVGDVWIGGGQSNMGLGLGAANNGPEEIKNATDSQIRFYSVASRSAYKPVAVPEGSWKVLSPQTASSISAVGYFFARRLRQDIGVPIGFVQDCLGGTPAEAWTSAEALRPLKDFDVPLAELQKLALTGAPEYGNYVMHWYDQYDLGLKGNWAAPEFDDKDWKPVTLPGGFAELGVPSTPAVAWFRKEITLPDPLPAGMGRLLLGVVEKMDTAFVNGNEVGASAWVENPRSYMLRPGILKPGKNVVTIRVFKVKEQGGFLAKPEDLKLVLGDRTSVALAGAWKGKLSVDARPPHAMPIGFENWPVMPTVLYQGMLAPIAPLAITGAIWYQGEQNSDRGFQYRKIMPAMIADWRKLFGQGDFPFYIVSLPAFEPRQAVPMDDKWSDTRESQAIAAATTPNSCLAVTIDTGEAGNIHPKEKLPVGDRLARCALANYYGKKIPFLGPSVSSVERLPGSIKLHFTNTEGGLVVKGAKLEEFSIAGEDRKWHWAVAKIDGDTIVVSSPDVPNPKEVRYAFQSNPAATLFNAAGLPAGPFRTDQWPLVTENVRGY